MNDGRWTIDDRGIANRAVEGGEGGEDRSNDRCPVLTVPIASEQLLQIVWDQIDCA